MIDTEKIYKQLDSIEKNIIFLTELQEITRGAIKEWETSGLLWRELKFCVVNLRENEKLEQKLVNQLNRQFFLDLSDSSTEA